MPALRLAAEQSRLRPVTFGPRGYGLLHHAAVGREAWVRWGGCAYSTPQCWIGQAVVLRAHREVLVLHHEDQSCVHPRRPANGRYSLLPEHREALFRKPRGKIMAQRQILMDLCPEGEAFFTELVHRRPHTWREQDLPTAWALFEQVGEDRMSAALRNCLGQGAIGSEYLRAHLEGWAAATVTVGVAA